MTDIVERLETWAGSFDFPPKEPKVAALMREAKAEIERLRACRTELDYVFEYYTRGLRPLDLRDWHNRACAALKDTKP